jgi:hypothetical protein
MNVLLPPDRIYYIVVDRFKAFVEGARDRFPGFHIFQEFRRFWFEGFYRSGFWVLVLGSGSEL